MLTSSTSRSEESLEGPANTRAPPSKRYARRGSTLVTMAHILKQTEMQKSESKSQRAKVREQESDPTQLQQPIQTPRCRVSQLKIRKKRFRKILVVLYQILVVFQEKHTHRKSPLGRKQSVPNPNYEPYICNSRIWNP